MTYTKGDVRLHSDGFGRPAYPAVNVKVHRFPSIDRVIDRFGCSEETAEKALRCAWEMHAEGFWEQAETEVLDFLGARGRVYSAGRSGGWIVVDGLPPIESWDACALAKWRAFEEWAHAEVAYLCSEAAVFESIAANEWALDDASLSRMVAEALA